MERFGVLRRVMVILVNFVDYDGVQNKIMDKCVPIWKENVTVIMNLAQALASSKNF